MSLLAHVLDECQDPDCEVHQIEVGLDEETVTDAQLAFFIAGAQAMEAAIRRELKALGLPRSPHDLDTAMLFAYRPIHRLGRSRCYGTKV